MIRKLLIFCFFTSLFFINQPIYSIEDKNLINDTYSKNCSQTRFLFYSKQVSKIIIGIAAVVCGNYQRGVYVWMDMHINELCAGSNDDHRPNYIRIIKIAELNELLYTILGVGLFVSALHKLYQKKSYKMECN